MTSKTNMGKELSNFYALEGLDGVGKSTIINNLKENGFTILRNNQYTSEVY